MSDLKVAVVGAGVIGLNTCLNLLDNFSHCELTIIAENFTENTTSYGPPGLFRPSVSFAGPSVDITREWIKTSYKYYRSLLSFPNSGVSEVSGFMFSNKSEDIIKNHYLEELLPVYRKATDEERHLYNNHWTYGTYFETLLTQCCSFLPWAHERLTAQGVKFLKKRVSNLEELSTDFDVVFNCTGLNAKYLCNDMEVVPIRGQLLKVEDPSVHHFYYNDYDTYIIPLDRGKVILGGCRNYESYNCTNDKYDTASIRERCETILPCLRHATFLSQWTGLRPHRSKVRVELETLPHAKVIHNYGHGGYGITVAPGTAQYAVDLLKEHHRSHANMRCRM